MSQTDFMLQICTKAGWMIGVLGFDSRRGLGIFLFTTASSGGKAAGAWSWPPTSIQWRGQRIRGAIPPLPNTLSWCGAHLKKAQGQLYLLPLLKRMKRTVDWLIPYSTGPPREQFKKLRNICTLVQFFGNSVPFVPVFMRKWNWKNKLKWLFFKHLHLSEGAETNQSSWGQYHNRKEPQLNKALITMKRFMRSDINNIKFF